MSKTVQTSIATADLSAGALTHEVEIGVDTPNVEADVELLAVMLKASSSISQVVTVSHVGKEHATNYTFTLDTATLSSATQYIFRPAVPPVFKRGDKIRFTCANSGTPSIDVFSKMQFRSMQ